MTAAKTMLRFIANTNVVEASSFIDQIEALLIYCTTKFGVDDPDVTNLRNGLREIVFDHLDDLTNQQLMKYGAYYYIDASTDERWQIFEAISSRNLILEWNRFKTAI